jgi:hypothetical protein
LQEINITAIQIKRNLCMHCTHDHVIQLFRKPLVCGEKSHHT